jgi:CubicO group peptidase (beta-lactamase class C family)
MMKHTFSLLVALALLWASHGGKVSQPARQAGPTAAGDPAVFFDTLLPAQLEAFHLPGAAVAFVQDGRLLFAGGYGYANVEQGRPVVAGSTLFRVASVSKLFVWTAVMQLVEQGKLDLHADANSYLGEFQIPDAFAAPITVLDLMNHTAGFEERALGTSVRTPEEVQPLGAYLAANMPARVRPPGELTAYSNYGAALAGYIAGVVAGMPFEEYVEKHIFEPLQMEHSSFRQPLPPQLAPHVATGNAYRNGAHHPQEMEWAQLAPAAALSATAADMANFMIAHLQDGRLGQARIVEEHTTRAMQQRSFTNDPRVNGYAHGFAEATINGHRVLGHTGDHLAFHSGLFLLPEHDSGLFIAFNGANGLAAVLDTLRATMDAFYPAGPSRAPAPDAPPNPASAYAGLYVPTRAEHTTAGKMVQMFQSIRVQPAGEHTLAAALGFPAQFTGHYVGAAPGVFRPTNGSTEVFGAMVFRSDERGRVQYLFQENNPGTAYLRAPWYLDPWFNLALVGLTLLLILSVIVWAPLTWWRWRNKLDPSSSLVRLAISWQQLLAVSILLFLLGFFAVFSNPQTVLGLPPLARPLFALPFPIAVLALGMVVFTALAWRRRWWRLRSRVHYTLTTLIGLAFVWWLAYWQLSISYLR